MRRSLRRAAVATFALREGRGDVGHRGQRGRRGEIECIVDDKRRDVGREQLSRRHLGCHVDAPGERRRGWDEDAGTIGREDARGVSQGGVFSGVSERVGHCGAAVGGSRLESRVRCEWEEESSRRAGDSGESERGVLQRLVLTFLLILAPAGSHRSGLHALSHACLVGGSEYLLEHC